MSARVPPTSTARRRKGTPRARRDQVSLQFGRVGRGGVQLQYDGVVNLRVAADKEHRVFVVGRFQRLADADRRGGDRGDLHQVDCASVVASGVGGQGIERCLGDGRQQDFAAFHAADTASGGDASMLEDRVEHDEHVPILVGRKLDQEALDHWVPLSAVLVCEGAATAKALRDSATAPADSIALEVSLARTAEGSGRPVPPAFTPAPGAAA